MQYSTNFLYLIVGFTLFYIHFKSRFHYILLICSEALARRHVYSIFKVTLHSVMTTVFVPGESDGDNKKKSGSMSDDGMLYGSCSLSLSFYI
jgi:hypothetical protein